MKATITQALVSDAGIEVGNLCYGMNTVPMEKNARKNQEVYLDKVFQKTSFQALVPVRNRQSSRSMNLIEVYKINDIVWATLALPL